MKIKLNSGFNLDTTFAMAESLGANDGIEKRDLEEYSLLADQAFEAMKSVRKGDILLHGEPALFMNLPYQESELIKKLSSIGERTKSRFDTVVAIGIGGSYLGNKVLFEALRHPYYNEDSRVRNGYPRLFFAGNNLDPSHLKGLLDVIDLKKTKFIVISKSGGTTEPSAAFLVVADQLKKSNLTLKDHVIAVTDPDKGILRTIVNQNQMESFNVPHGIGGRFSVLSEVGLITAAMTGVPIQELLDGAKSMDQACQIPDVEKNPALMYAVFCTILYKKKGKNISVIMPYSNSLKSLGEWYVQLLAESLGKEKNKAGEVVYEGRTPIPAVGTTDMHAQTQQHREGANIRLLTFIRIKDFKDSEIIIPDQFREHAKLAQLSGKSMSQALHAALDANAESLREAHRASITIEMPVLNAYHLGELLYFFEMATAFEGELLGVNAYDQPGVESYKKIMTKILS